VARDSGRTFNEAAMRFELWGQAFARGIGSLYLGLGPGPHARVPLEVVVRQRWEPDLNDSALGDVAKHGAVMESHNTFLEMFSQGGILILLAYAGLLAYAMRQSIRSGSITLPALVCVIAVFGVFHVILRHPIVWYGLCLCLGAVSDRRRPWTGAN
jgi:heme A synthase